ncbi:hypothetical protein JB92DRAFT_2831879 [Gautieria morchelliformis]|nr:hypothetical protein JB92DRAFT_2831879 [Gautieria morchelliformis]
MSEPIVARAAGEDVPVSYNEDENILNNMHHSAEASGDTSHSLPSDSCEGSDNSRSDWSVSTNSDNTALPQTQRSPSVASLDVASTRYFPSWFSNTGENGDAAPVNEQQDIFEAPDSPGSGGTIPGSTSSPGRAKKSKVSEEEDEDVLYSLFMSNILDGLDRGLKQRIYACAETFKGNRPTSNLDSDSMKSSHAQPDHIAPLHGAKDKERAMDVSQEAEMARNKAT